MREVRTNEKQVTGGKTVNFSPFVSAVIMEIYINLPDGYGLVFSLKPYRALSEREKKKKARLPNEEHIMFVSHCRVSFFDLYVCVFVCGAAFLLLGPL